MPNPDPYLRPSVGNQRDVYLYPSAPDTGGGPNRFGNITGTSTITGTVTGRVGKVGFFAGTIEVFGFVGGQEHNFGSVAGQIPIEGTVNGFNPEEEPAPEPLQPGRAFRPRGVRRTHRAGKVRGRIEIVGSVSGQKRLNELPQFHIPVRKTVVPVLETVPVDTRWLEDELLLIGAFD